MSERKENERQPQLHRLETVTFEEKSVIRPRTGNKEKMRVLPQSYRTPSPRCCVVILIRSLIWDTWNPRKNSL